MTMSEQESSKTGEGAATGDVKDVRAAYLHDKGGSGAMPDYTEWQRTSHNKSVSSKGSDVTDISEPERPTSPETEIVRLQIKARRKTLQQYQKMQAKLVTCNLELMTEIQKDEGEVHDEVSALLQQYDKFKGAMGNIRHKSEVSVQRAQVLLDETKVSSAEELESLEKHVEDISTKAINRAHEYEVLLKFKGTDKEYHLRAARTVELKQDKDNIDTEQKAELTELQDLVRKHYSNLNRSTDQRYKEIQSTLTASAVQNIPDTLKDLAQQNRVMEREILLHKDNISDTEREIQELKDKMCSLQEERKKLASLPKRREMCTPDMELSLDIPTYKLLPV